MNDQVPKARHADQVGEKLRWHDPILGKHTEHIRVILGITKSTLSDQPTSDVQTGLNGEMRATFHRSLQAGVPRVSLE